MSLPKRDSLRGADALHVCVAGFDASVADPIMHFVVLEPAPNAVDRPRRRFATLRPG